MQPRCRPARPGLWLPVVAYMAMLFWSSSQPTVPALGSQGWFYAAHVAAYCGLSLVIVRALARADWRRVTWGVVVAAAAAASLYGVSDEYHQRFVPGRTFDAADMAANAIGALAGAAGVRAWGILTHRVESSDAR